MDWAYAGLIRSLQMGLLCSAGADFNVPDAEVPDTSTTPTLVAPAHAAVLRQVSYRLNPPAQDIARLCLHDA